MQSDKASLPVAETDVPAGQEVHTTDPAREYVLAGQALVQEAVGKPDVSPYFPAAQSVHDVAPAREYFPEGHLPEHFELVNPAIAP